MSGRRQTRSPGTSDGAAEHRAELTDSGAARSPRARVGLVAVGLLAILMGWGLATPAAGAPTGETAASASGAQLRATPTMAPPAVATRVLPATPTLALPAAPSGRTPVVSDLVLQTPEVRTPTTVPPSATPRLVLTAIPLLPEPQQVEATATPTLIPPFLTATALATLVVGPTPNLTATATALVPSATATASPTTSTPTATAIVGTLTPTPTGTVATPTATPTTVPNNLPQIIAGLPPVPSDTPCASGVGQTCQVTLSSTGGSGVSGSGTGTSTSSMSWTFSLSGVPPGAAAAIVIATTFGYEVIGCPPAAPNTTTVCTGTTFGNAIQGSLVRVYVNNVLVAVGTVFGPGGPFPPLPPVIIVPQPILILEPFLVPPPFLPPPPPLLMPPPLPPPPPLGFVPDQRFAAPYYPEVPIVPEGDTLALLIGGLGAVVGLGAWRRWTTRRRTER